MGEWQRKRTGANFCFGAEGSEGEEKARRGRGGAITAAAPGRRSRRRLLAKVFWLPAISPCLAPNRCEGKESRRSAAPRKGLDFGGEEHDRKAASFLSSSTSSYSSSSSSSSSSAVSSSRFPPEFVAALQEAGKPKNPRPKRSPPKSAAASEAELRTIPPDSWAPPIWMLLLVVISLSVVVFCGRVCAIAWTSSLLFMAACLCFVLQDPAQKVEEECAPDGGAPARAAKLGGGEEVGHIL